MSDLVCLVAPSLEFSFHYSPLWNWNLSMAAKHSQVACKMSARKNCNILQATWLYLSAWEHLRLRHRDLSVRVPVCQKLQMTA